MKVPLARTFPFKVGRPRCGAACHNDDDCTACGICVDRCPMEAIKKLEDTAVVNRDRCIGCGVCVVACDVNAMMLLE